MSDETKQLKERIKELEDSIKSQSMFVPPKPDPTLAEDEWYAIFSNWQNLTEGTITKIPWKGGSNATSVFKVRRVL